MQPDRGMDFGFRRSAFCFRALAWFILFLGFVVAAKGEESFQDLACSLEESVCPALSLRDLVLGSLEEENMPDAVSRVVELNETMLEHALALAWGKSSNAYVMTLFYASWCPFSKQMRPTFDVLSSLFPSIYHIAVEESVVRPSVLAKYGVHSFPSLVLLTKGSTARYYGAKKTNELMKFYTNLTGLRPRFRGDNSNNAIALILASTKSNHSRDACPYPQAISPEKWFEDDTYLALASWFLVFRVLMVLLPYMIAKVKTFWSRRRICSMIGGLRGVPQSLCSENKISMPDGEQTKISTASPAGMSVSGWHSRCQTDSSSSNGPSIAVAESSSKRAGHAEELREVGGRLQILDKAHFQKVFGSHK